MARVREATFARRARRVCTRGTREKCRRAKRADARVPREYFCYFSFFIDFRARHMDGARVKCVDAGQSYSAVTIGSPLPERAGFSLQNADCRLRTSRIRVREGGRGHSESTGTCRNRRPAACRLHIATSKKNERVVVFRHPRLETPRDFGVVTTLSLHPTD